jgi:hypothetical protein
MRFRLLALLIVLPVIALIALFAIQQLTPPDFIAEPVAGADGTWTLRVRPGFVVNNIRSIRINLGSATLVMKEGVFVEPTTVELPPNVPKGTEVTVECELTYDRIMPCIETVRHQVILQ